MDALSEEEPSQRIGYDDFNESLSSKVIVHATLSSLGLTSEQLQSEQPNLAFRAISVDLGLSQPVTDGKTSTLGHSISESSFLPGTGADEMFPVERVAAFWSAGVIRKTFYERRSWWALLISRICYECIHVHT